MDEKLREEIALFRYEVIAPLLHVEPGAGALKRAIENLTDKSWTIPYSEKTRLGYGTIEHWMYRYKNIGLPGLKPSPRADNAQSRKITGEVADAVEEILKARPDLSGPLVLKELVARNLVSTGDPSLSSLWRFRKAHGLDAARIPLRRDRRPFAFEFPGDCWQCDLMYGPAMPTEQGLRRKAYLYAVIDDATRLICHAQFHFKQDLMALKDTLKQAFLKRGLPKRLYMDNAKIFQSKQLLVVGAQLGFQLLHTKPYRPEGRGKVERWFRTVRASFLPRLDLKRIESLDRLNRLLWAWIEGEYHLAVHRGLGEPPLDRWLRMADHVRPAPPDLDLERLFLARVTRRVKKDGTFTLKRSLFEAGVDFIGEKIVVRFDPFDMRKVWIGREGKAEDIEAFPVDLDANRRVARNPDPEPPPRKDVRLLSLDRLADEMDAKTNPDEEEETDKDGGEENGQDR